MSIFSKLFGQQAKAESQRKKLIQKLDGRAIKYVIERLPQPDGSDAVDITDEQVIGRAGALILKDSELLVYADGKVLFRAATDTLDASELLSLEGVILTAPDLEHDGRFRTIVAYYTYFLK